MNADAPRPQDALRVNPATAGKGVSRLVDDGILYTKRFGSFTAVDNVTFSLEQNKIHGLLGRNGAGKTTIMQMLTGQQFSTAGTVAVFGKNPVENAQVLQRVCFIAESQRYPETFKVKHVLASAPWVFDNWDADYAARLVEDFRVPVNRAIKKVSRGQLSAVGVIVGLASRSLLTFFDEPYLRLDAVARQIFYDRLLEDYIEHPRTIILSTHLIDEVSNLLEHVLVIDEGRILMDQDAEQLRGKRRAGHRTASRRPHVRLWPEGTAPRNNARSHFRHGRRPISSSFPFALGYSVTRRDFYLGTSLLFVLISAFNAAAFTILTQIEQVTDGWGPNTHLFNSLWFGLDAWYVDLLSFFVLQMLVFFVGASVATIYMRWRMRNPSSGGPAVIHRRAWSSCRPGP